VCRDPEISGSNAPDRIAVRLDAAAVHLHEGGDDDESPVAV